MKKRRFTQRHALQIILLILAVLILLIGLTLVGRGYFEEKDYDEVEKEEPQKYNPNSRLQFEPAQGSSEVFGEKINSPFVPNPTEKELWLLADTASQKIVGILNSDLEFSIEYILPQEVEQVMLYEDYSVAFVINNYLNGDPTIFLQKSGQKAFTLESFKDVTTTKSFFFYPETKQFYIFVANESAPEIYVMQQNRAPKKFYEGLDILNKDEIAYVDSEAVYLSGNIGCSKILKASKIISSVDCKDIPRNSEGILLSYDAADSFPETNDFVGEIKLYQNVSQEDNLLYSNELVLFNDLTFFQDKLIFIEQQFELLDDNPVFAERILRTVSIEDGSESILIENYSQDDLTNFIIFGENLLGIESDIIYDTLVRYDEEGIPASYPEGEAENWIEIDLGIGDVRELKIFKQNYIIN
jgi:hypothetical protein